METPFKLELYDKAFAYQMDVAEWIRLTFTPRHNQQPTGELVMRARHHAVPKLAVPGTRYRLYYKGEFLSSGNIDMRAAEGPQGTATVTYQLQDDFVEINSGIGWQRPTDPINDQTLAEYKTYTGSAEKIAKDMIRDNLVTRLGKPITIASNQDRGGTVAGGVKVRMDTLGDVLLPMLEAQGLGIRFRNTSGNKITVDCYVPSTRPLALTEAGGQVLAYSWTAKNPTVTRVVAGGANEKKDRFFNSYTSTLESEYGRIIEAFTDAADLGDDYREKRNDWENKTSTLADRLKDRDEAMNKRERALNKRDILLHNKNVAQAIGGTTYTNATQAYNTASNDYIQANSEYNTAYTAWTTAFSARQAAASAMGTAALAHRQELLQRAKEKVAEGHATFGFDLTLGEAPNFSYGGTGVHVGDMVTVNAGGLEITDVLRSATINHDFDGGLTVTPVVGDNVEANPSRKLGKLVARAFKAIQKLHTSR